MHKGVAIAKTGVWHPSTGQLEVLNALIELKEAENLKVIVHGEKSWLNQIPKRGNGEKKNG